MRRLILGTAGHIDHGKTSLVRALSGIDTDRLPEEKRRGITIDLGFASMSLDDLEIGIVDVPGHEALVRNMLAGATGIDLVVLVIAADEGIMPQTREHLAIMELLEVGAAVVALTKSDLVETEWLELVTADVCDVLSGTRFENAAIVPVSSASGDGIDALRAAISAAAHATPGRNATDHFRMPIDRTFTVHGTGTVVTGTVWSGEVTRDAHLVIMPDAAPARARGLQAHGHARQNAGAGERVALALAVDRDVIRRGDTLVDDAGWRVSMILTVRIRVITDAPRPLMHRQRIRFHLGTAEILGRVALLDRAQIEPGDEAWAQLRLEQPCVARAGDRFVVRAYSPVQTIAGGVVSEPWPAKRKRLSAAQSAELDTITRSGSDAHAAADALAAIVRRAGSAGVAVSDLPFLLPLHRAAIPGLVDTSSHLLIDKRLFETALGLQAASTILTLVDERHARSPLSAGLSREEIRAQTTAEGATVTDHVLRGLIADEILTTRDGAIARAGHQPRPDEGQAALMDELRRILEAASLEAPAMAELPESLRSAPSILTLLRHLESNGTAVCLAGDRFADAAAIDGLIHALDARFVPGQSLTTTDLKDAIGVSRKYLIPILEFFDRTGISRRNGEERVWSGRGRKP